MTSVPLPDPPAGGAAEAGDAVSVAIVEDDPHFRERFASIVAASPALALVACAADLASAMALADAVRADVWAVDLGLPDGSGIDLIRHLARHQPEADVMVVTVFGDDHHVVASLEAGATGYLLKEAMPMELVDAILSLRAGGSPISPVIARRLLRRLVPGGSPSAAGGPAAAAVAPAPLESPLTAREVELLQLVAKGLGFAEISEVMGISPHTVTAHVKNIYRKLAVHSRGEAVYEARQLGLLRP
jgi:DNA-binding NarL/FixJ family response regulator